MFYTRGPSSPGWEGVDLIDKSQYKFANKVPVIEVNGNINDFYQEIKSLNPDFIYCLSWQQLFNADLLNLYPLIGLHESLLPKGAGWVPIVNAILNDCHETGITLSWLDQGIDTGPIIAQVKCQLDPRQVTATELYLEMIELEQELLTMMVPLINQRVAPAIQQNPNARTTYQKINWDDWSTAKVARARTYPYA